MSSGHVDSPSHYVHVLQTQPIHHKAEPRSASRLPCPYPGHEGRVFQGIEQLLNHARTDHDAEFKYLESPQARAKLAQDLEKFNQPAEDGSAHLSSPDIAALTLDHAKETRTSGRKRAAESEHHARKEKIPSNVDSADPDYSRDELVTRKVEGIRTKSHRARLYKATQGIKGTASPHRSVTEHPRERPFHASASQKHIGSSNQQHRNIKSQPLQTESRQSGLVELQRYDPRYPGLLLQPDSRPISQEQLASEVKSIYAGLTMVETKCIHVDRAQASATQDPNQKLAPDHWQALIALHRTLLHEHHDFFLASQHPSASLALQRLAKKYTMPARMWKHGIHSFLELLRRRLPESLDYMLAFIYLSYQMMALLYETVPAFEETWIECLGDLGRYRMAIEDEDIRDRETWANVARSWYTKAADRNPPVGRLYHHLAILARPNALQQLYYYSRSLNSVEPFPSARDSIMTLFDPILGRGPPTVSSALPIDVNFIKAHACTFEKDPTDKFEIAQREYVGQLDNHIGRVTAKWKEQGVYTAVTNIASWFDYGYNDNILRQLFLLRAAQRKNPGYMVEERGLTSAPDPDLQKPRVPEVEMPLRISALQADLTFQRATILTNNTFALVLRRIGDKNVLPHVHVMLSVISTFASVEYVVHFLETFPWIEIAAFLNTLIKTETQQNQGIDINTSICKPVFPTDKEAQTLDDLPLPEDYLIRGLIWTEEHLPEGWFRREHDEEDRYLELASTAKRRTERVLRLGHHLATQNRWISYDRAQHMFTSILSL
ncbi:hypothetical protein EJ07DRAFT_127523 [Lizonia empirigonia]|nr:hypothetical protein EJ07DRAFT_127523 [Lizonia empirigonia]